MFLLKEARLGFPLGGIQTFICFSPLEAIFSSDAPKGKPLASVYLQDKANAPSSFDLRVLGGTHQLQVFRGHRTPGMEFDWCTNG